MSYLRKYHSRKDIDVVRTNTHTEDNRDETSLRLEAKFCDLNLNNVSAQAVLSSLSHHVQALDLSNNRINAVPKQLPETVIAINLSYNSIMGELSVPKTLLGLLEIKLSHNDLTSTKGLSALVNLQYLDISHNNIVCIEGIEGLLSLTTLRCTNNQIANYSSIRTLSYNKKLVAIDIANNPICTSNSSEQVRIHLKNLLPSLKLVDGVETKPGANLGYSIKSSANAQIHKPLSINNTRKASDEYLGLEQTEEEGPLDTSISFSNQSASSKLPWRQAPFPTPRPFSGKNTYYHGHGNVTNSFDSSLSFSKDDRSRSASPSSDRKNGNSHMRSVAADEPEDAANNNHNSNNNNNNNKSLELEKWMIPALKSPAKHSQKPLDLSEVLASLPQFEEHIASRWDVKDKPLAVTPVACAPSNSNSNHSRSYSPTRSSTLRERAISENIHKHNAEKSLASERLRSPQTSPARSLNINRISLPTASSSQKRVYRGDYIRSSSFSFSRSAETESRLFNKSNFTNDAFFSEYSHAFKDVSLSMDQSRSQTIASTPTVTQTAIATPTVTPRARTTTAQSPFRDFPEPLQRNGTPSPKRSSKLASPPLVAESIDSPAKQQASQQRAEKGYELFHELVQRRARVLEGMNKDLTTAEKEARSWLYSHDRDVSQQLQRSSINQGAASRTFSTIASHDDQSVRDSHFEEGFASADIRSAASSPHSTSNSVGVLTESRVLSHSEMHSHRQTATTMTKVTTSQSFSQNTADEGFTQLSLSSSRPLSQTEQLSQAIELLRQRQLLGLSQLQQAQSTQQSSNQ